MNNKLIAKYNIPGPRYTSYPTVPYWNSTPPTENEWKDSVKNCFHATNNVDGISLYIHLPFCESLCTYCGCNTRITKNHSVEVPYLITILKEWSLYLDLFETTPRIKELHLGGGTPTFFSPEHLKQLIEGITSTAIICPDAEFSFEGHPNNTTYEHLETLYCLGFRRVSFGIQDFDITVQNAIHRVQTFETVKSITTSARNIGYTSVNFDLIYGLPFQTREGIVKTINKVRLLRPDRIAFYSYAHVPWVKPYQRKFTEKDLPLSAEKRALYEIGRDKFIEDGYVEIGMDHFALKSDSLYKAMKEKILHRNFMGYTTTNTKLLVGLGMSSISDSWTGFAQNIKTLEAYTKCVNENHFPFFRGHLLTQDDMVIRKHILNIMCNGATSWLLEEEQCQAVYKAIERLSEIEKDGLIELGINSLKVKTKGRPFLRNICMAFDEHLWISVPQSQLFSMAV